MWMNVKRLELTLSVEDRRYRSTQIIIDPKIMDKRLIFYTQFYIWLNFKV
jgi:hypothetical protein